jgi:hypothetical protein
VAFNAGELGDGGLDVDTPDIHEAEAPALTGLPVGDPWWEGARAAATLIRENLDALTGTRDCQSDHR